MSGRRRMFVYLSLFLALFSFVISPPQHAQSGQGRSEISLDQLQRLPDGGFVIVQSGDGRTCRKMTEPETIDNEEKKTETSL